LEWKVGALIGIMAMVGDLFSSFLKRRMALPSSSMAVGLDQVPESLFPLAASRLLLPLSILDIAVAVIFFFIGDLMLSRILFALKIRDRPF
jgi:CDP-diglyceride synthetase